MLRDTLLSQYASTHQNWNSYLKEYRRYAPDMKRGGRTDGLTDRRMEEWTKQLLYASHSSFWALKVSNGAKIRNRYNQVPHLTQDTNGKVTNSQKTPQTRAKRSALSQQVTTKHI